MNITKQSGKCVYEVIIERPYKHYFFFYVCKGEGLIKLLNRCKGTFMHNLHKKKK